MSTTNKVPFDIYDTGLRIPVAPIRAELSGKEWIPHFVKLMVDNGNSALLLVTSNGTVLNDDGTPNHKFDLPMLPTPILDSMPVTKQLWTYLGADAEFHRSRFMKIAPGAYMPAHYDASPYWDDKVRVHIPIQTDPSVMFTCGQTTLHMEEGGVYLLNNEKIHTVSNPSAQDRIHLVIDVSIREVPRLTDNTQTPRDRPYFKWDDETVSRDGVTYPEITRG